MQIVNMYIQNCIESDQKHIPTSILSIDAAQDAGHHSFPGQVEGHADTASAPGHCDGWGVGS